MQLHQTIRLPLVAGTSSLSLGLGVALFGGIGWAPLFLGSVLPDWTVLPVGLLAGFWGLTALFVPFRMWKERAADIVLGPDGARIEGGPHHAAMLSWEALLSQPPAVLANGPAHALRLGEGRVVETDDPEEAASWRVLVTTLNHLAHEAMSPRAAPSVAVEHPDIVHCSSCGSPALPAEAAYVVCRSCGAEVPMPDGVRTEVRELHELRAARTTSIAALTVLLKWPRRWRVNAALLVALPLLILVWPASTIFFDEFLQHRQVFNWTHGVALFLFAFATTVGLFLFARSQAVIRRAVALTFARFGARPPRTDNAPYGCRACGAPLVRDVESPLTRCVYCRADNVVGLHLSNWGAVEIHQAQDLDGHALGALNERRRWRWLAAASLLILLGSTALLIRPITDAGHARTQTASTR